MKYFSILVVILISISQLLSQSSRSYCVDVDYYNPKTGKQSSYTLTAELESDRLIKLNFPSGGYLDENDFGIVSFDNKTAIASLSDGKTYKVEILQAGVDCFDNVRRAKQCKGYTKTKDRCKNQTDNKSGYCWKHNT